MSESESWLADSSLADEHFETRMNIDELPRRSLDVYQSTTNQNPEMFYCSIRETEAFKRLVQ